MRLGIIFQGHRREQTLSSVFKYIDRLRQLADVRVAALLDRPTTFVERFVSDHLRDGDARLPVEEPVVGAGERFPAAQNQALCWFRNWRPDWILWQPDDLWLEDGFEDEFRRTLVRSDIDVVFFRYYFFWDETRVRVDGYYPEVCDPLLWRYADHWHYDARRQMLAPPALVEQARQFGRTYEFSFRLLDHGFATVADRLSCALRAFQAGKIDAYTQALLDENPCLVPFSELKNA